MSDDIEVVISGIGCQIPCSNNLEEFGKNVLANEYLVKRTNRWKDGDAGVPAFAGETDFKLFDHTFFGMHSAVSYWTDPTFRAGYERTFEAIIDAGINPSSLRGSSTRVYSGCSNSDFTAHIFSRLLNSEGYGIMGHNQAMSCNRLSYVFDFKGESVGIASTNGSAQMGFRKVLEEIKSSACDAAVLVISHVAAHYQIANQLKGLSLISDDGITRSFDQNGKGSARSDSVVAFFIQRADQAKRCYARVVASDAAIVSDRVQFDMTLPSPLGMETFLSNMYRKHRVDPNDVVYVEAEGNGNAVHDEVELTVLARVFGEGRRQPLQVCSAKSNVGHTESASGAVGVCRAIVAMEAETIPASINCDNPIAVGPAVQVVTKNVPLKLDSNTAVAVTSIGHGGDVGHVILKPNEKAKQKCDPSKELPRLVIVSGRTEEGVAYSAEKVLSYPFDPEYLRLVQDVFCPAIRGYEFRSYIICPPGPNDTVVVNRVEKRTLWFAYSGMGSQWAGMGAGLMELPIFRDTIERLHALLLPKGVDLKNIITETGPGAFDNILKSFVGITACQVALTNVLTAMGLKPDGIIGHSVGELGCAYADGCLTEEQTILAAWARGVASNKATLIKGMMAAVGLGYKDIIKRLPPTIDVACRNSSTSSTLSGPVKDVNDFVEELVAQGVFARAVNVSDIAYHSRYIQPAAPFLRKYLEAVIPNPKKRSSRWVSTSVPLERQDRPEALYCSAEYLTNNLLSPVLFEDGLKFIPSQAQIVEVAPHGLLQAILKREKPDNLHVALAQRNAASPVRTLLHGIGKISVGGSYPDVSVLYPPVSFPVSRATPSLSPLVRWYHDNSSSYADTLKISFKDTEVKTIQIDSPHMKIRGAAVLPLSEMLEMVWNTLTTVIDNNTSSAVVFENVHVLHYEEIPVNYDLSVCANVNPGTGRFEVLVDNTPGSKNSKDDVRVLCWGYIHSMEDLSAQNALPQADMKDMEALEAEDVLNELSSRGLTYTNKYSSLASVDLSEESWKIRIRKGKSIASALEAVFQAVLLRHNEVTEALVLPRTIQRLEVDRSQLLDCDVELLYNLPSGIVQGPGLYLKSLTSCEPQLPRPAIDVVKSPLSFQFVPYGETNLQSVGEFLSLSVQLAMESVSEPRPGLDKIVILELQNGSGSNVLGPAVRSLLLDRMGVKAEVMTLSVGSGKKLSVPACEPQAGCLAVSGPTTLAEGKRLVAITGGLLLTRSSERTSLSALRVLAEQRVERDWLTLLCRPTPTPPPQDLHVVHLGREDPLPERLRGLSVLVWRGHPAGGVPYIVEEVRKRCYSSQSRLVFLLDEDAPQFSLSVPLFAQQLELRQHVNVLRRGVWGSWRALPLSGTTAAVLSASRLGDLKIDALGLNPRDRNPGKSVWSGHVDYVGTSGSSGRVMGVAQWLSDRSRPKVDPLLRWPVPENWSDKDAATVPYVYATVYHALCVTAELRKGESILIHEGASAIGQAAIRVAMQHNCSPIFVTVATEQQRTLIRKHFPQVDQSFVLSCAGFSFEWHARALSKGRGVSLVFSALPGTQLRASLNCLAQWGRFVHYGREDMIAASEFGSNLFLRSVSVFGVAGDHLFKATARDREAVVRAVQAGVESGVVQPVIGAKAFSAPRICSPDDARWIRDDSDCNKAVLEVPKNGIHGPQECSPHKSYLIVGGDQHEWLQVAGWLSLQGARKILAAPGGKSGSALVRHRQRAFRQLFGASLRVDEVRVWDRAAADRVVKAASATAPIDAVVVLVKDDPAASRTPALLHAALAPHPDAALVVLAEHALAACGLSTLCEARRSAGLRAACLSGRLDSAADHLADMLSGARPAVTLLQTATSTTTSGFEPRLVRPIPSSASALATLGRRLSRLPASGLRLRRLNPTIPFRECFPLYAFPPLGVLDPANQEALESLAKRLLAPVVCVESRATADLHQLADTIAQAMVAEHPAGPFNLLGWSISNPLTLAVSRCLEDLGFNVVSFQVDGDVQAVKEWASSLSDLKLLKTALADEESAVEVLEDASESAGWSQLVSQVVSWPDSELVDSALQSIRQTLRSIAKHEPKVSQPIRWRLFAVRTNVKDSCCFDMFDEHLKTLVMPRTEIRAGLGNSWLARKVNDNIAWQKLAKESEYTKVLLRDRS